MQLFDVVYLCDNLPFVGIADEREHVRVLRIAELRVNGNDGCRVRLRADLDFAMRHGLSTGLVHVFIERLDRDRS